MSPPVCCNIFVYGTLMRGHSRESCWPYSPQRVTPARVRGLLFDLGDYPALVLGDGWVRGECWELLPAQMAETLSVLDAIEEVPDLYVRTLAQVEDHQHQQSWAYLYLYTDFSQVQAAQPLDPEGTGDQSWLRRR